MSILCLLAQIVSELCSSSGLRTAVDPILAAGIKKYFTGMEEISFFIPCYSISNLTLMSLLVIHVCTWAIQKLTRFDKIFVVPTIGFE